MGVSPLMTLHTGWHVQAVSTFTRSRSVVIETVTMGLTDPSPAFIFSLKQREKGPVIHIRLSSA